MPLVTSALPLAPNSIRYTEQGDEQRRKKHQYLRTHRCGSMRAGLSCEKGTTRASIQPGPCAPGCKDPASSHCSIAGTRFLFADKQGATAPEMFSLAKDRAFTKYIVCTEYAFVCARRACFCTSPLRALDCPFLTQHQRQQLHATKRRAAMQGWGEVVLGWSLAPSLYLAWSGRLT